MFSRSINATSGAIKITIVGDATTWSITADNSSGVIYDIEIFIISGCRYAMQLSSYKAERPNLKLNNRPKQFLGFLPLAV